MVFFNQEEFQRILATTIKIKRFTKTTEEDSLILYRNGKYNIQSGIKEPLKYEKMMPFQSACFQLRNKLYVAGGERELFSGIQYLSDVFTADSEGKCQNLSPMEKSRSALSLSGQGGTLIALGGWNGRNLRTAQEWLQKENRWRRMHPLRLARQWAGSCVLKTMRAFCFCGGIAKEDHNSIQTVQIDKRKEWELLTISQEIARSYHLAAVPLLGQIILFGGRFDSISCMYVLTEHGDLLKDLSNDPLIPGYMCSTPAVVSNGKVYTMGQREIEGKWEKRALVFDGLRWSYL